MPERLPRIVGTTRVVGVIGHPVDHSRSPAMHNAAFRALGLDWVYVAFPVAPADLGAAIRGARALGVRGLNVTLPHKEAVIPHLDRLSPVASACAAVNTIALRSGRLEGHNTDAIGLARALAGAGLGRRRIDTAVLLGSGGAARAALVALDVHADRIAIAARRPARAARLAREMGGAVRAALEVLDLADLAPGRPGGRALLRRAGAIVNATSLGMAGEPFAPIDVAATRPDCLFYDLVYNRTRTPFLVPAARLDRPVSNGLGMLLHQGAEAFALWTGRRPPLAAMRRALGR